MSQLPRIGAKEGVNVVPTWELAPILQERIEQINREVDDLNHLSAMELGGRQQIVERAAMQAGTSPETYTRKLYSILNNETVVLEAGIADHFLMAADVWMEEESLIELPGTVKQAEKWVGIHYPNMKPLAKKRLARKLYRFSTGYAHGLDGAIDASIGISLRRLFDYVVESRTRRKQRQERKAA